MIKNKLHTISDEDAIEVARILLKSPSPYEYAFKLIRRFKYDPQDGTDAEEAVKIYFKATVTSEDYVQAGWQEKEVLVELIEYDRYYEHPYFIAFDKYSENDTWKHCFLSNHIEGTEYLQAKGLI